MSEIRRDHEQPSAIAKLGWRFHYLGIPYTVPHLAAGCALTPIMRVATPRLTRSAPEHHEMPSSTCALTGLIWHASNPVRSSRDRPARSPPGSRYRNRNAGRRGQLNRIRECCERLDCLRGLWSACDSESESPLTSERQSRDLFLHGVPLQRPAEPITIHCHAARDGHAEAKIERTVRLLPRPDAVEEILHVRYRRCRPVPSTSSLTPSALLPNPESQLTRTSSGCSNDTFIVSGTSRPSFHR